MSNTARATVYRGYADEWARLWNLKLREHKVDIERAMLFGQQASRGGIQYTDGVVGQVIRNSTVEGGGGQLSYTEDKSYYKDLSTIFGCMFLMESGNSVVYDTCGISKVEIGELAEIIKALLNKDAKILRPEVDKDTEQDIYVGSRAKIKSLISELKINESSLEDQILCTAQYLKTNLK